MAESDTECFPLELGKTGLDSSAYDGELTGASLNTATKLKTAGALTSEEPAMRTPRRLQALRDLISGFSL